MIYNIIDAVLCVIDNAAFGKDILSLIFSLLSTIPSFAVGARRLHDIDKSGWWQLLILIPLIGFVVLIVFFAQKGSDGPNR
nr:DUF805 domain-containing protein [Campylobacter sp.]